MAIEVKKPILKKSLKPLIFHPTYNINSKYFIIIYIKIYSPIYFEL